MFAGRQLKQGKKGDWGGFHLKRRLKTKGNLRALKDHSEKIEMKWKTERHRQFWHGDRAAQNQQKYNLYNSVVVRWLCVCVEDGNRKKHFYVRLLCKERLTNAQTVMRALFHENPLNFISMIVFVPFKWWICCMTTVPIQTKSFRSN